MFFLRDPPHAPEARSAPAPDENLISRRRQMMHDVVRPRRCATRYVPRVGRREERTPDARTVPRRFLSARRDPRPSTRVDHAARQRSSRSIHARHAMPPRTMTRALASINMRASMPRAHARKAKRKVKVCETAYARTSSVTRRRCSTQR